MGARMIGYNTQRNNFDFNGKFPGSCQCFATSAWMFMSHYNQDIKYDDDTALSSYVDDVSDAVGKAGIGEKVKQMISRITGNSAYWWDVQKSGISKWLGVTNIVFKSNVSYAEILELSMEKPVICGTSKLGGLPGGHIILAVDNVVNNGVQCLLCNDPYGDANTFYKNQNGACVIYGPDMASKFTGNVIYMEG